MCLLEGLPVFKEGAYRVATVFYPSLEGYSEELPFQVVKTMEILYIDYRVTQCPIVAHVVGEMQPHV